MDNKTQPSFIPRQPVVVSGSVLRPHKPVSIFSLIGTIIFLAAAAASGVLFAGKLYFTNANEKMEAELQAKIENFDRELTEDLSDLNARIVAGASLATRHVAMTNFFEALSLMTTEQVQFNDFMFREEGAGLKVEMKGLARGYGSLARQSAELASSTALTTFKIGDLNLDERGMVSFALTAFIASPEISYSDEVMRSVAPPPVETPPEAEAAPVSSETTTP